MRNIEFIFIVLDILVQRYELYTIACRISILHNINYNTLNDLGKIKKKGIVNVNNNYIIN